MTERLVDIVTQARGTHRIWMRDDCYGSPHCCVEIHIEESNNLVDAEVHLNVNEVRALRKALKKAMKNMNR